MEAVLLLDDVSHVELGENTFVAFISALQRCMSSRKCKLNSDGVSHPQMRILPVAPSLFRAEMHRWSHTSHTTMTKIFVERPPIPSPTLRPHKEPTFRRRFTPKLENDHIIASINSRIEELNICVKHFPQQHVVRKIVNNARGRDFEQEQSAKSRVFTVHGSRGLAWIIGPKKEHSHFHPGLAKQSEQNHALGMTFKDRTFQHLRCYVDEKGCLHPVLKPRNKPSSVNIADWGTELLLYESFLCAWKQFSIRPIPRNRRGFRMKKKSISSIACQLLAKRKDSWLCHDFSESVSRKVRQVQKQKQHQSIKRMRRMRKRLG